MTYYKIVSAKLTYGEFWRLSGNFLEFLIAAGMKLFGSNMDMTTGLGRPEQLISVEADEVPPRAQTGLDKLVKAAAEVGFRPSFWYTIPMVGAQEGYGVALRGNDDRTAASMVYGRQRAGEIEMEKTAFGFVSKLRDRRLLLTSGKKKELNRPPEWEAVYYPGLSFGEVLDRHNERLSDISKGDFVPIRDDAELEDVVKEFNLGEIDYFIERGLYELMSDFEATAGMVEHKEFLESA